MKTEIEKPIPTLADVAQRAGVSTATVSRCLNAPARVQPETRDRVLLAVRDLGYTPNFGAKALMAGRTNTIGAVIPTMENAIFAQGLQAFQDSLHARGVTLLVACSQYQPDAEEAHIRSLIARGVDGLMLIGHRRSKAVLDLLAARKLQTVIAWAYDSTASLPSVGFDNHKSMLALTEQVIAQGHQNIGYISAHLADNDRASARLDGVQQAMARRGLAKPELIETDYAISSGADAFRSLWQTSKPTAVMCGNDVLAVGAVQGAKALGLRIPKDVSITGFDDIELATVVEPNLTTVHVPHREMGQRAAKAVLDMVQEGLEVQSLELPTDIKLRDSLGPVPVDPG